MVPYSKRSTLLLILPEIGSPLRQSVDLLIRPPFIFRIPTTPQSVWLAAYAHTDSPAPATAKAAATPATVTATPVATARPMATVPKFVFGNVKVVVLMCLFPSLSFVTVV